MFRLRSTIFAAVAALTLAGDALAEEAPPRDEAHAADELPEGFRAEPTEQPVAVAEPAGRKRTAPGARQDRELDPVPEPPQLRGFQYRGTPDVVQQAGVGSGLTYGHAGVLEFGGSAAFTGAANYTQIGLNPRVGYFLMDNFEISGILGLNHISAPNIGLTIISLLAEPSVHVPMTHTMFGFAGLGVGPSYAQGEGFGVSMAPRIGLNFLVGRSGIVTPALHVQYNTHQASATPAGGLVRSAASYGLGVDFSIMY